MFNLQDPSLAGVLSVLLLLQKNARGQCRLLRAFVLLILSASCSSGFAQPELPALPARPADEVEAVVRDLLRETPADARPALPNTPGTPLEVTPDQSGTDEPPPTLSELITLIVRECVPETYEDVEHWGMTDRRWDGLNINNFKTSRRWKEVNNGFWRRFSATLINPEETLLLEVQQLESTVAGETPFFIKATILARCEGTFAQWTYGVKGLNGTVVADATVELNLKISLVTTQQVSWQQLLPILALRPRVDDVKLRLRGFDVRKVGILGGTAADVLGNGTRSAVESLLGKQEKGIQRKLQKRFDRWADQRNSLP